MSQTEIHIANFVVNWLLPLATGFVIAVVLMWWSMLLFVIALCKMADRQEPKP